MRRPRCGFDKLAAGRRMRSETRRTQLERYTRSRDFSDARAWQNQSPTVLRWQCRASSRHSYQSGTVPNDFAGRGDGDEPDALRSCVRIGRTQDIWRAWSYRGYLGFELSSSLQYRLFG